jgi:hypothetical protein
MNIRLSNGSEEITISLTCHGSEMFGESLKSMDMSELTVMLKDPGVEPGERRDVLNEIIDRRADQLAEIESDPETFAEYREEAIRELARIIQLGLELKRLKINRDGLGEFAALIGLKTTDLELPGDCAVVDL